MKQQHQNDTNSHSESSQPNFLHYDPEASRLAQRLYNDHINELIFRINMFQQDRPGVLNIDVLPAGALLSWLLQLHEEFGLESIAFDIDDVINALLQEMSTNKDVTDMDLLRRADQVEKLMKLASMLRFIESHVIPYTQV